MPAAGADFSPAVFLVPTHFQPGPPKEPHIETEALGKGSSTVLMLKEIERTPPSNIISQGLDA